MRRATGRSRAGFALLLGVGLLAAGCGGPIQPEELKRGVETLESNAAAGQQLAEAVSRDRTRSTFVRVQARSLGEAVTHEAEKLADAEASRATAPQKREAVALAEDISDALGELQLMPGDELTGRHVQDRLARAGDRANRLAREL